MKELNNTEVLLVSGGLMPEPNPWPNPFPDPFWDRFQIMK